MNRREALLALGGAAVLADPLFAASRSLHARLTSGAALKVLDPHQNDTVVAIAEMIIPATDTPGATDAKVNEFVDLALSDWLDADGRKKFLDGLAEVDDRSRKRFTKDFTTSSAEQRVELLELLDAEVAGLRDADKQGTHREPTASQGFFQMMKRLTLLGYFTSEVGVTEELHNPIIPGRYDGCVLLDQRGK
jgi:Gluconate 2-dehydrogenase subunit 3